MLMPENPGIVSSTQLPNKPAKNEKILGYILLAVGILIIALSTLYAVSVLTGNIKPVKVFELKAPEIPIPSVGQNLDTTALQNSGVPSQVLDSLKPKQGAQSGVKIIPDEAFSDLVNMFIAYILVMILASSGSKFATIGVQLIKEIKVQAKV